MSLEILLLLIGGLVLLVGGGEFLVRGASRLATVLGVSPLVVGLTVVAYGTSAPEMAVSIRAGLAGNDGIALANVVGSNIFNILFILGACALAAPLVVNRRLVRIDVPVMIAASVATWLVARDGRVALWEGLLLAVCAVAYTAHSVIGGRAETAAAAGATGEGREPEVIAGKHPGWLVTMLALAAVGGAGWALGWFEVGEAALMIAGGLVFLAGSVFGKGGTTRAGDIVHQIGFILGGLGVLVKGAGWLVGGAVTLAQNLGVSDTVIGLTIVAAGTSLPEVAASLIATIRGQRDIAIGNVVGSNIANVFAILGVSAVATPGGLSVADALLRVDIPVMVAVAAICLPMFYTGYLIRRWEGAVLMVAYVGYTTWLVFEATGNPAKTALGWAFGAVFAPIVLATFAVTGVRALTTRHRRGVA